MEKESHKEHWTITETKAAKLEDKRLMRRFGNVLNMLIRRPKESIPVNSKSWAETKAAYRFFDHDGVTHDKVMKPHQEATIERMAQEPVVLLPQDTTELNYTSKPETKGLGKLCYEAQQGLYLHPTLAITPGRVCLGVVNMEILIREALGKKANASLPIEQKESVRWLNSYRVAQTLSKQLPETKVVSIADREGDIYEIFAEASEAKGSDKADWIIRSQHNRCLTSDGKKDNGKKLLNRVQQSEVIGVVEFDLPATPKRKARRIKQEIRAITARLKPPYRKDKQLRAIEVNAVLATEVRAPEGEQPIKWLLLTSLPVDTNERALQVIEWYLCRWQIEVFFRILKSGCKVESLQLQELKRLEVCLAMYMIITWRILFMTMLGRCSPDLECDVVFEDVEWRAVYIVVTRRPPPSKPPGLHQTLRMIQGKIIDY